MQHTCPITGFSYTLRHSKRVRRAKLSISGNTGLQVVVPPRFNPAKIPAFLQDKADWVTRTLQKVNYQAKTTELPKQIELKALHESFNVVYEQTPYDGVKVVEHKNNTLCVFGNVEDAQACKKALRTWLSKKARLFFKTRLAQWSDQTKLVYKSLSVRNQKSRWGSCSAMADINLNMKLLFLEENISDYVIVHELCHTKHMNHSTQFWAEVATHMPHYKQQELALKSAWPHIPEWSLHT